MTNAGGVVGAIADDFFFIAHDEYSGALRINAQMAGLGLAGALLGELVMTGSIAAGNGTVWITGGGIPPDRLARKVLGRLLVEPEVTDVRAWVEFFARSAVDEVGGRLAQAGLVHREEHSRRGRRTPVASHWPSDPNQAAWRGIRLARALNAGIDAWQDVLLAGLLRATGLLRHLLWEDPRPGLEHLDKALRAAPPHLHALVTEVEAIVGNAVLTHQT